MYSEVANIYSERTYSVSGGIITCIDEPSGKTVYTISMGTEEEAQMLMEDLYFGEYDGG